jgi:hypothetical protein
MPLVNIFTRAEEEIVSNRSASFQAEGCRVLRLVKADLAPAGEEDFRKRAPSLLVNRRAWNIPLDQGSHLGLQVIAHEVELMRPILSGGVEGGFGWGQSEDQPAMAGVDGFQSENIAEECAIRLGILAVDNDVSAGNHCSS